MSTPNLVKICALQALRCPSLRTSIFAGVFIEKPAKDVANIILQDQFLLVEPFQQLTAQSVDSLALLVHYIVIFEQMFADSKCWPSTAFCAASIRRVINLDSIGTPSSMPSRCSRFETHSLAKMRIRSSSSER